MRKVMTVIVLIASVATSASISAGAERKAVLRLIDRDPLTVKGEGFKPRERVGVHVYVLEQGSSAGEPETARRLIRASATGSFRVVFAEAAVDRCNTVRVVAIRGRGGEVVLKVLASPMCAPGLSAARP